eukprot:TRINITY_DN49655_c0_g1_i1.p1 TRINITY_DN49655_c0_g1~~TRINITY_DN49655_c0_g1_i1.p1  ORF type:complete len:662 (-),score=90.18 TRINITY_DN49655_c0_g1_i1:86-1930(-)
MAVFAHGSIRSFTRFVVPTLLFSRSAVQPCAALGSHSKIQSTDGQTSSGGAEAYHLSMMTDQFTSYSKESKLMLDDFYDSEQKRLESAIEQAQASEDKSLLETTAVGNEESRLEAKNALSALLTFATTVKASMGGVGSASSCQELMCGARAFCVEVAAEGARCHCQEGYDGDGFICNPPAHLSPHALLFASPNQPLPQVADIYVSTLSGNTVAVVFRDLTKSSRGFLLLGVAEPSGMRWGLPSCFSSESKTFSPVLTEMDADHGRLAIAYRDESRGGSGLLVGARVDTAKLSLLTLGAPKIFASNQAQTTSLIALPGSRVAVIYSEHVLGGSASKLTGGAMYGAALVAKIPEAAEAQPDFLWTHRFTSGPVARISTARLSPSSFVLAYRRGELSPGTIPSLVGSNGVIAAAARKDVGFLSSDSSIGTKAEASCMVIELRGDELIFLPRVLSLEPDATQIWARSVSLVQENVVSYTYHSGNEQVTKQATLFVDPTTGSLSVLQKPEIIARGFTPFVTTLSAAVVPRRAQETLLLQRQGPRTLTLLSDARSGFVQSRLCKVTELGTPAACQDLGWKGHETLAASGTPVGDGRILVLLTDAKGRPFYQLIGLLEDDF